ncbi:PEGA domain-containing protein, partial [Odoribacter laneus]|uniref:PEGA domain-containing protein n=1 Tax=Odoribacter laneus TaxID=626933 RepID=UPI000B18FBA4
MPYGAKRLTIKHPQLGMLRDYVYPERIEKAGVYELVLTTGRVETVVHETVNMDYLVIRPDPADALVYIDEVYESGTGGVVQKFVPWGKHTYRVEHPLYHTEAGQVEVGSSGKKELSVSLRPAFGSVEINSFSESGAEVYIDGERVGTTPYRGDWLKSGEHRIRVLQAMYQPSEKVVTVRDNETSVVSLELQPNFGVLTFTSDPSSEIWINNELKGQGSWSGRLNAGSYLLEVRREHHRSFRQTLTVGAGENRTVALGNPVPIYGMLNITSTPGDALIRLNGQEYGRTPALLKDILIGTYTLELSKEGYARESREITIEEGKVLPVNIEMRSGRTYTIQTDRSGDSIYIDGKRVGVS